MPTDAGPAGLPSLPVRDGSPCEAHGCSVCCHDTEMLLTEADLARLSAARPGEGFWMEADDGFLQLRTREGPAVAGHTGAPCWFLDDAGRCTVHARRPEGCRLYPAIWDVDEVRTVMDADCPHTDGFLLPRTSQDAVRRLADRLVRERDGRVGTQEG